MKLILGTAQLSSNYGISNTTGIPKIKEVNDMFSICRRYGIKFCDTALNYGDSHQILKNSGMKIITKINLGEQYKTDLNKIFNEFDAKKLDSILVHNCDTLLQNPYYWDKLLEFQKENNFKLGVSVYTPKQVDLLLSKGMTPSILQIPYNLFDQKFEESLAHLKDLDIEIHARSIFLQGLFFLNIKDIPKKLEPLTIPLKMFNEFCNYDLTEKIKQALHFVLQNKWIDKFIVGVENPKQLLELLECYDSSNEERASFKFQFDDFQKQLLNPTNW